MGIDYTVYVGPYLKVHNPETPTHEEYHSCNNEKCENHTERMSDKFCPKCGRKIVIVKVPTTESLDMWEILEELDETLRLALQEYKPKELEEFEFLIPNSDFNDRESSFDPCSSSIVEGFENDTIQKETELFKSKYKKEIKHLNEKFGNKNVSLLWGVLSWAW